MGILARRSRIISKGKVLVTPQTSGYIGEFLTYVLAPLLPKLVSNNTRVITNAGGLDPLGLKILIEKHLQENRMQDIKVAAIWGDDLLPSKSELLRNGAESFEPLNGIGKPEPVITVEDSLISLNAYLGADPTVIALQLAAQIIVTGRVVDS